MTENQWETILRLGYRIVVGRAGSVEKDRDNIFELVDTTGEEDYELMNLTGKSCIIQSYEPNDIPWQHHD